MSLIVEGARRIARDRDEKAAQYTHASKVAEALFGKVGKNGIPEKTLITQVQEQAGVVREIAVYVVDELRADGIARKDRESRVLYPA